MYSVYICTKNIPKHKHIWTWNVKPNLNNFQFVDTSMQTIQQWCIKNKWHMCKGNNLTHYMDIIYMCAVMCAFLIAGISGRSMGDSTTNANHLICRNNINTNILHRKTHFVQNYNKTNNVKLFTTLHVKYSKHV